MPTRLRWVPVVCGLLALMLFVPMAVFGALLPPARSVASAPLVAPPNDDAANAEVIPATGPFPYLTSLVDVTDATAVGDPTPSCGGLLQSNSVWYRFTPSNTGSYRFSTSGDDLRSISPIPKFAPAPTSTSLPDTVLAVYSSSNGAAGPFTQVACDNDGGAGFQSETTATLIGGQDYFIVVTKWNSGAVSAPVAPFSGVQLYVDYASASNDLCTAALPLQLGDSLAGTTVGATDNYQASSSDPAWTADLGSFGTTADGRDVVYSFTAPTTGTYGFRLYDVRDTVEIGSPNPALYLIDSCPGGAGPTTVTLVAGANRTGGNALSEIIKARPMVPGQTVYAVVDAVGTSVFGFRIQVDAADLESPLEPNNTPATASTPSEGMYGTLSSSDIDFFTLPAHSAGDRVFAMIDGSGLNSAFVQLRVTTSVDTLEYDSGDNDVQFGSSVGNVAGTTLTAADAFLRINHSFGSATEPYRLFYAVRPNAAEATSEVEPNNTVAQAGSSPLNYFSGTLSLTSDVDVYTFDAAAGDTVFASLSGDPDHTATALNARMELLDANGNLLFLVNDPSGSASNASGAGSLTASVPNSPGEALLYSITASGTYYLRVAAGTTSSNGAGDYLLSISTFAAPNFGGPGEFSLDPATLSVNENAGTATLTVQRSGGSAGAASVDVSTQSNTALAGLDFTPLTTTLTFADGETSQSIAISITDDLLPESDETFTVTLSNATGATLGAPSASVVTILDDDLQTPTPTPTMVVTPTDTPTPTVATSTPTPDTPTPSPTVATSTPTMTPDTITPTPTSATSTPTMTPDTITPTPTSATSTPTPSATTTPTSTPQTSNPFVVYLPLVLK